MRRHSTEQIRAQRKRYQARRLAWMDLYYQGDNYSTGRYWYREVPAGRWSKSGPFNRCSCDMCRRESFAENKARYYRALDRYDRAAWNDAEFLQDS